jgi:dihydroorotate dehydrogenase (NAD+) catalytic subunit
MPGVPDLAVEIGRLRLKNPVMPASGTFGYGEEFRPFLDLDRLGAVVVKTLTWKPLLGSAPRRSWEVPSGLLASIGLQNVGVEAFVREKLPFFAQVDTNLIVSIGGETVEEYLQVASRLDREARVDALEVNVSCPNVERGGVHFGTDPFMVESLVGQVRDRTDKTLLVKLAPMGVDVQAVAGAAQRAGADALSLINGPPGMAVDIRTRRSRLGRNRTGGLAGPAVRALALHLVYRVVLAVDIPVVGVGGITSAEDALEFLVVGATAVQVGTWNFVDPSGTLGVVDGLEGFLVEEGLGSVREVIGTLI